MKLAVDIGNTTTTVGGLVDGEFKFTKKFSTGSFSDFKKLWEYWMENINLNINNERIDLLLASVVPKLTKLVRELENSGLNVYVLEYPWKESPLKVELKSPETAGADRIAGAGAMYEEYGPGIVVDFGTATTVEVILPGGRYVGGVIMPGVQVTFTGLFKKTAALPRIEPLVPENFECDTTKKSLQSGIYYGLAGAVDRTVKELRNKFDLPDNCPVVATGGRGKEFMDLAESLTDYDELIVLKGLLICSR